jgi:hypothetical protein
VRRQSAFPEAMKLFGSFERPTSGLRVQAAVAVRGCAPACLILQSTELQSTEIEETLA